MVLTLVALCYNDGRMRQDYQAHTWNSNTLYATLACVMESLLDNSLRHPEHWISKFAAVDVAAKPSSAAELANAGYLHRFHVGDPFTHEEVVKIETALQR